MKNITTLRLKHYFVTHTRAIIAGCLLVLVIGGLIAFTATLTAPVAFSPLATADTGGETTHTAGVSQSVSVDVTDDTTAYSTGDTLSDRSRYPKSNTGPPVVTATADAQQATLTHLQINLEYEAAPREDTTDPFYTNTRTITETTPDAAEGEVAEEIPITEVLSEKADLRNEFGDGTVVTASVVTEATFQYETPDGTSMTGSVSKSGPITDAGNMYGIGTGSEQATHTTGDSITGPSAVSVFVNILSLFSIIASIVVLGLTTRIKWIDDPQDLAYQIQHARFREWVTEVESFTPQGNVNVVEVTSLSDLVNLAIDTQRRVLYHSRVEEYLVMDDSTMFKYVPEATENGAATEFFGMDPSELDLQLPNGGSSDPFSDELIGDNDPFKDMADTIEEQPDD